MPGIDPRCMEDALNEKLEEDLVRSNVVHYSGLRGTAPSSVLNLDGDTGAVEALIVLFSRVCVESVSSVADEIRALGRVTDDEDVERSVVNGGAHGMDSWTAVCSSRCEEPKARPLVSKGVDQ